VLNLSECAMMCLLKLDNMSGEIDSVLIANDENKRMIGHERLWVQGQGHGHPSSI